MLHRLVAIAFATLWAPLALAQASGNTNVTRTTWEIYAIVGLAFVIGFLWVLYKTRQSERRSRKRGSAMS